MKIIQKYLCLLALTLLLVCAVVYSTPEAAEPLPCFAVQSPEGSRTQTISIFDAGDGNHYVFLPAYAEPEQVTVSLPQTYTFALEEIPLADGMDCSVFELEKPYALIRNHEKIGALWFFRSANVATMYIDTLSGNMKYLHQDKANKETASVMVYTADGAIHCSDERSTLTGRGNASWEYDKRPYTLTLSADTGLLGMAPAAKWVLLANAGDETNLNNKLIFSLASRVGLPWTPDSRWVDLYLNGEYSGLYLLTEKVEVHENRVDIDTDAGDFLCRVDIASRWPTLNNPFRSASNRTVEISAPKYLSVRTPDQITELVNRMEAEFSSGTDLSRSSLVDLDSWVRRYLIDEISANIDSDLASSYFYYSNGKFSAGPVWDYDMALGNSPRNHDPYAFVAKNYRKSRSNTSKYYGALYSNEAFHARMLELYRTEFVPELKVLLESEFDLLTDFIRDASRSNSLRWRSMYDNLPADVVHTPEALKDYFSRRVQFLDEVWLQEIPYCTLQFETSYQGSSYVNVSVQQGCCLESSYINTESVVWIDSETGEVFDFSQPITKDMILWKQSTDNNGS